MQEVNKVGVYYLDMENDGGTSVSGAPAFGNISASGRLAAAGLVVVTSAGNVGATREHERGRYGFAERTLAG